VVPSGRLAAERANQLSEISVVSGDRCPGADSCKTPQTRTPRIGGFILKTVNRGVIAQGGTEGFHANNMRSAMKKKIWAFVDGRKYKCVSQKTHKAKSAERIRLVVMQSSCPDCGEIFLQTITLKGLENPDNLSRSCRKCRSGPL
jgi:hypothetical protein